MSEQTLEARCRSVIASLSLGSAGDVIRVTPLSGGVASDIAVVDLPGRQICLKFALRKLKVKEDWYAPVHRNKAEYRWLEFASTVAPHSVPALYGISETEHGFAMEFLAGPDTYLWKTALLKAAPESDEATRVGRLLGRIHAASTKTGFDPSPFWNRDDFRAIRLEPYLTFTATRHSAVADRLNDLADQLYASDRVLVHGDVSPKNILFRDGDPVLLDAECATMGDPCFDVAFCLNHLVLKALHLPGSRRLLFVAVLEFWRSYSGEISWEHPDQLNARVASLLPALMLARVDGKSPVEYLNEPTQDLVRRAALAVLNQPPDTLAGLIGTLTKLTED